MDGNELSNLGRFTENPIVAAAKTAKSASSLKVDDAEADSVVEPDVTLSISDTAQIQSSDVRRRSNEAINVINVAVNATDEIAKLVESISGIVEQAQQPDLSDTRLFTLQKEANQLVTEIKNKAQATESNGVRPLLGENIRFDIEQRYGYALEIILPDEAKEAFGLGQISLSMKDSIIDTLTRVEQAKKQFDKLRESVNQAGTSIRQGIDAVEVALQNSEASQTSIRSLDQALSLASKTYHGIGKDNESALGSFSKLGLDSLSLLQS
jgi:flagellin-like hook-associated protein FlgL